MEENKFEKQVQQKMDELKIQPSDSVWERIEAQIEKKNPSKRRWVIFLLLFCLLVSGGFLFWNSKQQTSKGILSEKTQTTNNKPSSKKNTNTKDVAALDLTEKKDKTIEDQSQRQKNKRSIQPFKFPSSGKITTIITNDQYADLLKDQKETPSDFLEINLEDKSQIPPHADSTELKPGDALLTVPNEKLNNDCISEPAKDKKSIAENDISKQNLPATVIAKENNNKKWKFGITFSAGISNVKNNIIKQNGQSYYSLDPNNVGVGNGNSGFPSGYVSPPSSTGSGFGFLAGVFTEKNISTKTSIILGINFKSFNTTNDVGRNLFTGAFNSQASSYKYTNHYNFIEIPVSIKTQVVKGKLPVFWEGGLSISRLLNSNALQFNAASGNYYTDNSVFNKTQLGIRTSFAASFFSKQRVSVLIGPAFYYDVSRVANEGLYNKKHFVLTGLQTRIVFGK